MKPINPFLFNPGFDGASFFMEGSPTGVLLFHGFTATTLEVRGLAEFIQSETGYTVMAPLLPGHGTSPQDLSKIHFKDWLDAADIAFAFLKEKSVDIVVGGESMGGLLALYLAANRPEIKGILLFAPALKSAGILKARIMKSFIFASPKKNLAATLPGFLPWQGYLVNPLKAVAELGNLQNQVRNLLPQVQQPVLIFQGKQDETIDPESSTTIFNSISSINKELIELNNCGHCVLLDIQHLLVYRKTVSFLTSLINSDTG